MARGISAVLTSANPLLSHYNKLVTQGTEAGLLDKYWSLLKLRQLLKSNRKVETEYYVFKLEHVLPIFIFPLSFLVHKYFNISTRIMY